MKVYMLQMYDEYGGYYGNGKWSIKGFFASKEDAEQERQHWITYNTIYRENPIWVAVTEFEVKNFDPKKWEKTIAEQKERYEKIQAYKEESTRRQQEHLKMLKEREANIKGLASK